MIAKKKLIALLLLLAGLTLAALLPLGISNYMLRVIDMMLITYVCVLSLFVIFGMTGQMSFAQAGYWGLGAYITAILTTKFGVAPLLALLVSALGTGLFVALVGMALFRLHGHYFGFATIGVVMTLNGIFQNWTPVTGGANGIGNIPPFGIGEWHITSDLGYFYLLLFFAVAISLVTEWIHRSALGRSFMAIRDNEIAAKCMGVNSYFTKNVAYVISGVYCGIAGSLFAFLSSYTSATSFVFPQSVLYLVMLMLGGYNSLLGPIIGTVLLIMLPEWFRPLQEYILLVYGIGVILLMVVMPDGLIGGGKKLYACVVRKKCQPDDFDKSADNGIG
ncbi:MAG: branched-chain amino acid transporter permease [Firmicutes bacterium]|nr:branched-chain amino acid transporter permease [Bacillota bacterium]